VSKKNTEIISLRLDSNLIKRLHEEAESKQISLNSLLNQITISHLNWFELGSQMGRLSMSRRTFRALLEDLDDEIIIKIGNTVAKEEYESTIRFFLGKYDMESIIQFMEKWLKATNIQFRHITDGGKDKYIIQHDLGKKWSLLFITRLEALFSEFGYYLIKKNSEERNISFEIEKIV